MVYNMYFTEKDNKWLWKICGGDPFVEFKDVQDFQLAPIDSDLSKGEVEFANCKIIYQHLSFLTASQACAVSNIKSRFFFSGGTRAGLFRNSIAKCWWGVRNTYDPSNENPFEKLDIIGSNDISSKISDIFYSNNFSANPVILNGIVKALKNFKDENTQLSFRDHIRPLLQLLNAVGGGVVLDCLDEDEIADILIDNIYGILQGDQLGVETGDESEEYEDFDADGNEMTDAENFDNDVEDEYVVIGQKVNVRIKETGEHKTILVNYLPNSIRIPPLAKILLGCRVGDEVAFQGKTYKIEEIQKRHRT